MKTVWKWEIPIADAFELDVPRGAEVLSVQVQHGRPMIWFLVDQVVHKEKRRFRLAGTGHPIDVKPPEYLSYVGSIQMAGGDLVWHLFALYSGGHGT